MDGRRCIKGRQRSEDGRQADREAPGTLERKPEETKRNWEEQSFSAVRDEGCAVLPINLGANTIKMQDDIHLASITHGTALSSHLPSPATPGGRSLALLRQQQIKIYKNK